MEAEKEPARHGFKRCEQNQKQVLRGETRGWQTGDFGTSTALKTRDQGGNTREKSVYKKGRVLEKYKRTNRGEAEWRI